ncbi:MAG: diguanylate cyclase [Lachnospiraceae bacterium]|nr:diguanylate cyclase [Lachnospiraceae bacterium]
MNYFSHKTEGYKEFPVYLTLKNFLDGHFIERNLEKTFAMLDEEVFSSGPEENDVVVGCGEVLQMLQKKQDLFPESIPYEIKEFHAKEITEGIWELFAKLNLIFLDEHGEKQYYATHFSGCLKQNGAAGKLTSLHMSETSYFSALKTMVPLRFATENTTMIKVREAQRVFDIMCQSMPGGIISGYAEDGFPIYFVNDMFLEMLGYSSYEEYNDAVGGLALNGIHPEDQETVSRKIMESCAVGAQYEIEYRIRRKNGEYLSVYDMGRIVTTPDQREIVICVLLDMTENVKLRDVLLQESVRDELTGLYNRRGGLRNMEEVLLPGTSCTFAILDVDNLKLLNDLYNHQAGDHALQTFAELAKRHFGRRTLLARFGGDEFIAFVPFQLDKRFIERVFQSLQRSYCAFIEAHYPDSQSSLSIGCVTGTGTTEVNKLYQVADELMYSVKKNGKRGYKIIECC